MNNDARTDAELLAATTLGRDAAFTLLVRRYIRAATLLAAQVLGDRDEAEDIVQDAFTVVYRNASNFDATRPFAPWFFSIVRRLAANRRSRDLRRERLSGCGEADRLPCRRANLRRVHFSRVSMPRPQLAR